MAPASCLPDESASLPPGVSATRMEDIWAVRF